LYYLPKDIIGGDFYWYKEVGEYNFIAIADCTGHGTSGALLSVMCSNFLTKIVEEDGLVNTHEILNECRDSLVGAWSESTETIRDGMDISLLRVHRTTREMQWSGANSSLWLINGDEVMQFKGNKQAIARTEEYQLFDAHEISSSPGSLLFMSTDGLFDQFGGAEDRKLGRKRVIQELKARTTLQEKKESLVQLFSSWKFQTEQTDDVCFLLMSVV
jgi:serine phosphatase RsbU (regulator of sigma subunit)